MPNGQALQFASLPTRQPNVGTALLQAHAIAAVIRLSVDPTRSPSGTMEREVTVEWARKPGNDPEATLLREIGWNGIPNLADSCVAFSNTWNDHELTGFAAVAVMALLVHDLEGGVIERVLQIGSGGDFLVLTRRARKSDQIEVSGVREDTDGQESRKRLREKAEQVLTHCKCGFASVTTFSHPPGGIVRSCLHFVRRRRKTRKPRK